ncbi:MAG: methionine--tRNA ligase [Clostridia bacterium]|nr:methionine--tRNA ligase [Clostridia bacterium]
MTNIVINGAWPYANGSLHIGHLSALLPGDILARYFRAKGDNVFYVSGSDCHGTPITIRARQEGISPQDISDKYHKEFCQVFERLGFSFDLYTKTSDDYHKSFVTDFHKKLYESKYIEERTVKQAFCNTCQKTLSDRLVIGVCPYCGRKTQADQCSYCGAVLDSESVTEAVCSECNTGLDFIETTQLFLLISKLKGELTNLLESHPYWRKNAIAFTGRYINEGLRDRAITRDLDWGIDVPKTGYENKKIYIWAENVLGYFSATSRLCEERNVSFEDINGENSRHYYVHGKDNIPFHTVILPSLLLAHGGGYKLPDEIISSEHLTLDGKKLSKSQNWVILAKDIAQEFNPDSVRYFFIANGPEKRDTDFSRREFIEQNNTELVGAWGNLVNRTLAFAKKYLNNSFGDFTPNDELRKKIKPYFSSIGEKIEKGNFKEALDSLFELVRYGNKYYDTCEPWETRNTDIETCKDTIYNCTYLIGNLAILLQPFLPFSSDKIIRWLGLSRDWREQTYKLHSLPDDFGILFSRIEK